MEPMFEFHDSGRCCHSSCHRLLAAGVSPHLPTLPSSTGEVSGILEDTYLTFWVSHHPHHLMRQADSSIQWAFHQRGNPNPHRTFRPCWCSRRDLNPHASQQQILSLPCLPIPTQEHKVCADTSLLNLSSALGGQKSLLARSQRPGSRNSLLAHPHPVSGALSERRLLPMVPPFPNHGNGGLSRCTPTHKPSVFPR